MVQVQELAGAECELETPSLNLWKELTDVLGEAQVARLRAHPAELKAALGTPDGRVRGLFRELVDRKLEASGWDVERATRRVLERLLDDQRVARELAELGADGELARGLRLSQRTPDEVVGSGRPQPAVC